MNAPLLEARGLTKDYRIGSRAIPVLRGVDLALQLGEKVALVGSSGTGKSTLLHLLGLLDTPSSGSVWFEGSRVDDLSIDRRASLRHRRIGFVFQFYHLIPELSAYDNVRLGSMMDRGMLSWWRERKHFAARAGELIERVGLSARRTHRPAELSGGERQRIAIARALIAEPAVILADEPTGNLDPHTASGVLDLLFSIGRERGLALLLVTHDESVARRCDRVLRLSEGAIAR
ncbi:MAG: ABC transporter ATP-binding protein [Planctomycetota bacterium]